MAVGLLWGACFVSAEFDGTSFRCTDGACPSGLVCNSENLCVDPATPDAGVDCSACDALATCTLGSASCVCPTGYDDENGDGSSCTEIDECAAGTDSCSTNATCTNVDGGFECACNLGFEGDGVACLPTCTRVLIFDDCALTNADCASVADTQFADDAAIALGYEAAYFGADEALFLAEFDAGSFDVLVIESSLSLISAEVETRILGWIAGGGKIVFSYWDLDADPELAAALGVNAVNSFTVPLPLVPDPNANPDPFDALEQLPSPISFTDPFIDDGDELVIVDQGAILARFNDANGPGSIAETNNGNSITLGFLPFGMVFEGPADADNDGKNDVTELYTNVLGAVCDRIP